MLPLHIHSCTTQHDPLRRMEVLGLSHRVLVMSAGRQRAVLDRDQATAEAVMSLAVPVGAS